MPLGGFFAVVVGGVLAGVGTDDEPQGLARAEVAEGPVHECHHAVAEANERQQVDKKPGEPAQEAAKMHVAGQIDHGFVAAHDGHRAFVAVRKRLRQFAVDEADDVFSQQIGVLLGHRGEHGQALGHSLGDLIGHVADGEDVGQVFDLVPGVYRDAAVAGDGRFGQAGQGCAVHASSPDEVFGGKKIGVRVIGAAVGVAQNLGVEAHLHS